MPFEELPEKLFLPPEPVSYTHLDVYKRQVLHGMTTREELEAYPHVAIVDDLRGILPVSV